MLVISRIAPSIALADSVRFGVAHALAWLALALSLLGLTSLHRARTTINPVRIETASSLVTTGVYRFTRNPMYLGLTSLLSAWAVYLAVPGAALGPLTFLVFTTRYQIIPEERALRQKFGSAYDGYARRVRRWL